MDKKDTSVQEIFRSVSKLLVSQINRSLVTCENYCIRKKGNWKIIDVHVYSCSKLLNCFYITAVV